MPMPDVGMVPPMKTFPLPDRPLVGVLTAQQAKALDQRSAQVVADRPEVKGLAGWIAKRWEEAKRAKYPVELKMIEDLRQRDGQYDPEELALIRQSGGSEIFMLLTSAKCRAAKAWLMSILLPADGERSWDVETTPIPSLPPELESEVDWATQMQGDRLLNNAASQNPVGLVMPEQIQAIRSQLLEYKDFIADKRLEEAREDAKERAVKMGDLMEDQLDEGGYAGALEEALDDLVTYPAGIVCGPIVRKRNTLKWDALNGFSAVVQDDFVTEFERVSPFNIYPLPNTVDIQTGGFFHRHQGMSTDEIAAMIGVEGYNEASIRAAIDEYGVRGLRDWLVNDVVRATAEGRPTEFMASSNNAIDVLEFWGKVPGNLLLDFGMSPDKIKDRTLAYEVNVWTIGRYVIRAVINPNPMGKRPYGMASYERIPGSFWGKGIPRLIRDCQRMCNAMARAIANNAAMASGPQVGIFDIERLPAGDTGEKIYPWKVWHFTKSSYGDSSPPLDFFNAPLVANELLAIYNQFYRMADDMSGIQASASYGADRGQGAASTASGQSMLRQDSSRLIGSVVQAVDEGITVNILQQLFVHNMLFSDDDSIKGDLHIVARGASAIMQRETAQVRRNEFLQATNNPTDLQILGIEGRADVLREVIKTLQMDKDILPESNEELLARIQGMLGGYGAQTAMANQAPINNPQAESIANKRPDAGLFKPTAFG